MSLIDNTSNKSRYSYKPKEFIVIIIIQWHTQITTWESQVGVLAYYNRLVNQSQEIGGETT